VLLARATVSSLLLAVSLALGACGDAETTTTEAGVDSDIGDVLLFEAGDGACEPTCTTCGADDGCGGTCQSGSCPGGAPCVAGKCLSPTTSFLAPPAPGHFYTPNYGYIDGFARNLIFSIGSEAPSTIVYTTDGSTPGTGSPHASSPVTFPIGSSGVIQWFADTGAPEAVHSAGVTIDTRLQTYYGFLVDVPNLGPDGPVAVVAPGATVSGTANWQAWTGPTCPGCRYQLIYGIENAEKGCFWDGTVGAWPGKSQTAGSFSVTAPSAPGTYRVNVTYTLQNDCATGMGTNPFGSRPTQTFAWIVVK
jgi:hypothetical protein